MSKRVQHGSMTELKNVSPLVPAQAGTQGPHGERQVSGLVGSRLRGRERIEAGLDASRTKFALANGGRRKRSVWVAQLAGFALAVLNTAAFAQPAPPPSQQPPAKMSIGFVEIAGDPRHEPLRAYERLYQFRDPNNACLFDLRVNECYALELIVERGVLSVVDVAVAPVPVFTSQYFSPEVVVVGLPSTGGGPSAAENAQIRAKAARTSRRTSMAPPEFGRT